MPLIRFVGVAVVVLLVAALAVSGVVAQVKPPADFSFEKGKDSPGVVTFSHEQHTKKVDKCTGCHVKVFKMKKGATGPLTMEAMKAGQQCGACHNGKTEVAGKVVFAPTEGSCNKCHRP